MLQIDYSTRSQWTLDSVQLDIFINDLGQRFQICWAHNFKRLLLLNSVLWKPLKWDCSRAWRLGDDGTEGNYTHRHSLVLALDCLCCWSCVIPLPQGAEVGVATCGCSKFQKWCFRANSALLNRTKGFGSCPSVGKINATWHMDSVVLD